MTSNEFPRHNEIIAVLYGTPARQYPRDIMTILDAIAMLHKENLPLLARLITTGSVEARKQTRKAFLDIISQFQSTFPDPDAGFGIGYYEEYDDEWENLLERYEHPTVVHNLLDVWSAVNVMDEIGLMADPQDIIFGVGTMRTYMQGMPHDFAQESVYQYWRGIVASTIVRHRTPFMVGDSTDLRSFAEWSGKHDDIGNVIDTACERLTLDREILQGIMDERDAESALREGFL